MADPFTPPAADLTRLHTDIADALTELRGARDVYDHAPSIENANLVEACEWRLDRLLNRHPRAEVMA